jgi:putative ABC transport system permease protein
VLGGLGGAVGLALAYGGLKLLVAIGPETLPRLKEIGLDPLVVSFAAGISLFAALIFGLVPILKYAAPQISSALRAGGRGVSHSRERIRMRNVLVVAQLALALVLLISSGLMIRTFDAMRRVEPGFTRPEQLQVIHLTIPETQVKDEMDVMRMQQRMLEKLAAIPGVQSVALGSSAPLERINSSNPIFVKDKDYPPGVVPPIRRYRFIAPEYLKTTGTRLLAGREFTWTDIYDKHTWSL